MPRGPTGPSLARRVTRALLLTAFVMTPISLALYYALVVRPAQKHDVMDRFHQVDVQYDCCSSGLVPGGTACGTALRELVSLKQEGESRNRRPPPWLPTRLVEVLEVARAESAIERARTVFSHCPAAQELEQPATTVVERLCGVMVTGGEREMLAREAARRGHLIEALASGECGAAGYEAGLRRIQVDFANLCASDACLEVLLGAPGTSRPRVREIAIAHLEPVLSALGRRLGEDQDPRAVELLADMVGAHAPPIAALARGNNSEQILANALDLLEKPLDRRTAIVLEFIRSRLDRPSAPVAALLLDAAGLYRATESELNQGLSELQQRNCELVERVAPFLSLRFPERADAALPVLVACPKATQALLTEGRPLALTEPVLEAFLLGRFAGVEELLVDRLEDAPESELRTLVKLAARPDLSQTALRILRTLGNSAAARQQMVSEALAAAGGERVKSSPP